MKLKNNLVVPLWTKKGWLAISNVKALLHKLQSSDSGDDAGTSAAQADLTKPWLKEFNQFLDKTDELSDGQTLVQWCISACLSYVNLFHV